MNEQDRALWLGVRRGLLVIVAAIEKEKGSGIWVAVRAGLLMITKGIEKELAG